MISIFVEQWSDQFGKTINQVGMFDRGDYFAFGYDLWTDRGIRGAIRSMGKPFNVF